MAVTTVVTGEAPSDTTSDAWPHAAYGWYLTIVLAFAYFVSYLDRSVISLLVEPIKSSLLLSDTQVSFLLGFAFSVFYALGGIPLGYLADRANRKILVVVSVAAWSAMTALCGFAKSFWTLFCARVGVGIGEAGLNPAAMSMISDCFPPARRHFPLATFVVGGTLGGGLAIIVGAGLLEWGESLAATSVPLLGTLEPWQWVFVMVASAGLPAVLAMATLREPRRQGLLAPRADVGSRAAESAFLRKHWRCLAGLFIGTSLLLMVNVSYLVWGPTLFVRIHGMDLKHAGVLFGLPCFIAGLLGSFATPAFARFIARRTRAGDASVRAIMWIAIAVLPAMAVGPLLTRPLAVIATVAPAIGLMIGTAAVAQIAAQVILPNQLRARAIAFYNLAVNAIAFGVGPSLVGLLTDHFYRDEHLLHHSIATLALLGIPAALIVLAWSRTHVRAAAIDARTWAG
jgi:MFS family permease